MKEIRKTTNIIIRVSEKDKEKVRALAERNQMSMSEYITYLIRREYDKENKLFIF